MTCRNDEHYNEGYDDGYNQSMYSIASPHKYNPHDIHDPYTRGYDDGVRQRMIDRRNEEFVRNVLHRGDHHVIRTRVRNG